MHCPSNGLAIALLANEAKPAGSERSRTHRRRLSLSRTLPLESVELGVGIGQIEGDAGGAHRAGHGVPDLRQLVLESVEGRVSEVALVNPPATKASHRPVVGRALNWQGHPQAQLQLAISSPEMLHWVFAMSAERRF